MGERPKVARLVAYRFRIDWSLARSSARISSARPKPSSAATARRRSSADDVVVIGLGTEAPVRLAFLWVRPRTM
jgi:hypothetical protein